MNNSLKRLFLFKIFYIIISTFFNDISYAHTYKIIEKYGSNCPSGFYSSGGFCKSHKSNKRNAILNKDKKNCPTGYFSSAKYYCLSY